MDEQRGNRTMIRVLVVALSIILISTTAMARLSKAQLEALIESVFAPGQSPIVTLHLMKLNLPRLDPNIPEERATIGIMELTRGNLFLQSIDENRIAVLGLAISSFNKALQVLTFDDYPEQWLQAKISLADAKFELADRGDRAQRKAAIKILNELTTSSIREFYPSEWAAAEISLARSYAYGKSDKSSSVANLELAIATMQAITVLGNPEP
jgi:hypothetical protein